MIFAGQFGSGNKPDIWWHGTYSTNKCNHNITSLIVGLLDIYINAENLGIMFGWKGLVTQQTGTINNDNHKICERNVSLIWLKYSWSALSFLILFSLLPSCLFFFVLLFFFTLFIYVKDHFVISFIKIYILSFEVVCVHMLQLLMILLSP